jgi:uncharacterized protein YjcR
MAKKYWWTAQRLQALELELQGRKTEEIAVAVGATVSTIEGWRRRSAWRDRRQQLDEAAMEVMRQRAVTRASAGMGMGMGMAEAMR